eukprot:COSAG01_NODE_2165_length_8256_cov_22.675003_3_plen_211_part_00
MRLRVEAEALRRETDAVASRRKEQIRAEIAQLSAEVDEMSRRWEAEKERLAAIKSAKADLEAARRCAKRPLKNGRCQHCAVHSQPPRMHWPELRKIGVGTYAVPCGAAEPGGGWSGAGASVCARREAEVAERDGRYEDAGRLKYDRIPELEELVAQSGGEGGACTRRLAAGSHERIADRSDLAPKRAGVTGSDILVCRAERSSRWRVGRR